MDNVRKLCFFNHPTTPLTKRQMEYLCLTIPSSFVTVFLFKQSLENKLEKERKYQENPSKKVFLKHYMWAYKSRIIIRELENGSLDGQIFQEGS